MTMKLTRWQVYAAVVLGVGFTMLLFILATAGVETTTIEGKVVLPGGATATGGRIYAQLSQSGTTPDVITDEQESVGGRERGSIGATGDVTLALVPNDVITPAGTYYRVRISTTGPTRASWSEKWQVDTSPDPVDIGSITRLDVAPGLTVGDYVKHVSTEPSGACSGADTPTFAEDTSTICQCVASTWSCTTWLDEAALIGSARTYTEKQTFDSAEFVAINLDFQGVSPYEVTATDPPAFGGWMTLPWPLVSQVGNPWHKADVYATNVYVGADGTFGDDVEVNDDLTVTGDLILAGYTGVTKNGLGCTYGGGLLVNYNADHSEICGCADLGGGGNVWRCVHVPIREDQAQTFIMPDPSTTKADHWQTVFPETTVLQRIRCSTDTGTATISFDERSYSSPNTDLNDEKLSAPLVCATTAATTTSFADESVYLGQIFNMDIQATTGTPTVLRVQIWKRTY